MKVHKPIGSKERFLEMFQGVNKMNLNENIMASAEGSGNIDKEAFDELVQGNLNIEQTNTQASSGENYIEIVGSDDAGNVATFKFLVTTTPGDQDGVATVDSAKLIHLGIQGQGYNTKSGEGVNTIVDLNNQRGQEMIEVVSEYVDTNDDMPDISEEMYEDAIKFIDKVPYKKGTEQIQTNKAYADQKPTNDALRVDSNQLDKFVSESDLEDSGDLELPPDFRMPKITNDDTDDGTKGIDPLDEPIEFDADEPVEAVSPEKTALIHQAYDNLVAAGNQGPTIDDIMRETDKIQGITKTVEKTRAIPRGAEEFYEGESEVTDINADDVVAHGYNEFLPEEQKIGIIKMADERLSQELGVKKFQMPKGDYLRMVKRFALEIYQRGSAQMNEEAEKSQYPDPIGKKFKPKRQFPKKKKKVSSVVKLSEEEEIEQVAVDDEETGNQVPGGLADDKDPVDFNAQQIMIGMGVEMEHTDDPKIALEIAMDHLMEIPDYYTRLNKMEAEAGVEEPEAEVGVEEPEADEGMMDNTPEEEETTDELLGFKPHNVGDYTNEEEVEIIDEEEIDLTDYQGEIGDRYQDGKGNQLTVKDEIEGGVTLQSQDGDKEIATQDIQYLKSISEEDEFFDAMEKTIDLVPLTTERDKNGFRHYHIKDDMNKIYAEKDGELYVTDEMGEPTFSLRMDRLKVNGLIDDENLPTDKLHHEKQGLDNVNNMFGIDEGLIKTARQALNKRGLNEGMTKKEAVQILIKHNIR